MAHGTTGTMDFGLERHAQRFAATGFAVLVFDCRHFGASEGQPRQLVNVGPQVADWRTAVRFAHSLPQVDPNRVALWGTSRSAGHVVSVAARDPRIAAVVAQLPFLDVDVHHARPRPGRVTRALFAAAIRDAIGGSSAGHRRCCRSSVSPTRWRCYRQRDYELARTLAADAAHWPRMNSMSRFQYISAGGATVESRVPGSYQLHMISSGSPGARTTRSS